jgi:dTDP-4-dehydrorhamnose 3,5-epimerase
MVQYRCSEAYDPDDQVGVRWDDETLAIKWPTDKPNLSDKDSKNIAWNDLKPAWESWRYKPV